MLLPLLLVLVVDCYYPINSIYPIEDFPIHGLNLLTGHTPGIRVYAFDTVEVEKPFAEDSHWMYYRHTHGPEPDVYESDTLTSEEKGTLNEAKNRLLHGDIDGNLESLEPAVRENPRNLLLLNELAHAYYQSGVNQANAFALYLRLLDRIQELYNAAYIYETPSGEMEAVVIDCRFDEAYLNLGVLYIDRGEYERGFFELVRALYAHTEMDTAFLETALVNLTKAYFGAKEYDHGRWLLGYTLRLFPECLLADGVDITGRRLKNVSSN